jgi:plasmid stabilization system protein ParE
VFVRAIVRRTGTVLIRARVSGAGTLKAIARARVGGKRLTVARRTGRPERAGIVTLRLKAGRKARTVIRRRNGRLRARTTLVFTPRAGVRQTKAKTVTFRLKR